MKNKMGKSIFGSVLIILTAVCMLSAIDSGGADTTFSDDWPMLQHDMVRSGFSSSNAPNTNATLWTFGTESAYSSPVVVNGHLFI